MQRNHKEHLYKILVIGDLGVGKTSIIKRYVHQTYSTNYRATIGVDFALKVLNWDSETVRLQLWDIAGKRVTHNASATGLFLHQILLNLKVLIMFTC
ncbi:ras-related protein Rab-38 [Tachysurus ichikawai]